MTCRICLDDEKLDDLIQPCNCNTALVHKECLLQWLRVSGHTACEICTFEYDIVENNAIPRDQFNDEFFKLIGDILMEVIDEKYNINDTTKSDNE